jgi:hypothetical protein
VNTGQRKGNEVNTRRSFFSLLLAGPAAAWAAIHIEKPWFVCRDCGASVSKGDTRYFNDPERGLCASCAVDRCMNNNYCSRCHQYVRRARWAKANLHPMYYVDGQGPLCDDCSFQAALLKAEKGAKVRRARMESRV